MQTLPSDDREINRYFSNDQMQIHAVDASGFLASVEINLLPRWRQAHGIENFSTMVDIILTTGVTFAFPDGSNRYEPGCYQIALRTGEIAILSDPDRATFLNIYGQVVEFPHRGGRA